MTSRFRFISTHRGVYGVQRLTRLLAVSRSGYYRWLAGESDRIARAVADDELAAGIRTIHAASGGAYGAPRVAIELRAQGRLVNRKRVERVMRQRGIIGRHLRRRIRTTIPGPAATPVADLLRRDFTATGINQRWCGDITYLRAGGGWLYLATVIDIASRRLIGWSIANHMRTALVTDALHAAVAACGGHVKGVVMHTDRGGQYTSATFADACHRNGIHPSRGHIGSSYDNALAEAFFRHPQTRTTRRRDRLHLRSRRPPTTVPLDRVLQPPPTPLRDRLHQPSRLRESTPIHYSAQCRVVKAFVCLGQEGSRASGVSTVRAAEPLVNRVNPSRSSRCQGFRCLLSLPLPCSPMWLALLTACMPQATSVS